MVAFSSRSASAAPVRLLNVPVVIGVFWKSNPTVNMTMDALRGHSITYRIALGPHEGHKAFTLQSLPAFMEEDGGAVAKAAGLSLHALGGGRRR